MSDKSLNGNDLTPWEYPFANMRTKKVPVTDEDKEKSNFNVDPAKAQSLVEDYIAHIGRDGKITVGDIVPRQKPTSSSGGRTGAPAFNSSGDIEKRYEKISNIFDQLIECKNNEEVDADGIEVLYANSVQDVDTAVVSKISLDAYYEGIEDLIVPAPAPTLSPSDFESQYRELPVAFIHRLVPFLDHRSLLQCREVCRNWNKAIVCCEKFLDSTVFVMGSNLELIKRCKSTHVKWRNIRCQLMPCPEFYTAKGYQQKYLMNKLVQGPKVFFTNFIRSIILDNFEINKENLVKWLSACANLTQLELQGCTFKNSKVSWTKESLQKVTDKMNYVKATEMSLASLVDFGKLILTLTKSLSHLEISQKGVDPSSVQDIPAVRKKTLERDLITLMGNTIERNAKTLRSLLVSLELFQTSGLQAKLFQKISKSDLNLLELGFDLRNPVDQSYFLGTGPYGVNVHAIVRDIMNSSSKLRKLHLPFLLADFSDSDDISWEFPTTITDIGMQINSPMAQNQTKFGIRKRLLLKKATFHQNILCNQDLVDFRKCFPWIIDLEINSSQITDAYLQEIIEHLPKLKSLALYRVKEITDAGITGMDMNTMKKFTEGVPAREILGESLSNYPRFGHALHNMLQLKTFKCRGNINITDIGVSFGFGKKHLEHLELSGKPLPLSPVGLRTLAAKCPNLKSAVLDLSRDTATSQAIKDFASQMIFLQKNATQIALY